MMNNRLLPLILSSILLLFTACDPTPSNPLEEMTVLPLPIECNTDTYKSLVTQKPNTDPQWVEKWGFDPENGARYFTLGKPDFKASCDFVLMAQESGGELRIWLLVLKADLTVKTTIELYYEDMVDDLFAAESTIDPGGRITVKERSMKFDPEGNIVPNSNVIQLDLKGLCAD